MEGKKSVIVYVDWITIFEKLTEEEAGKLIKHFFQYVNDMNPTPPDRITEIAFENIKQQLKRDLLKWKETTGKRSLSGREGGKKSGEARRTKKKQKEANEANASKTQANEAVTVNVNDNVNVNDTEVKKTVPPHELLNFIDTLPNVLKLKTQPTNEECQKLIEKWGREEVVEILFAMENTKALPSKYTNVYLTANNWLNQRTKKPQPNGKQKLTPEQQAAEVRKELAARGH